MEQSIIIYVSFLVSILSLCFSVYSFFLNKNSLKSKSDTKLTPTKRKEKFITQTEQTSTVEKIDDNLNNWKLEITGTNGKKFDIHVEWSDMSSDIKSGVVPVEVLFKHPKGVVPQKVVGMAPNGDAGVHYSWKLNGFHW